MGSLLNLSSRSLLNKVLPYDAEIEYLEGSGKQWIDTSIVPTLNTKVVIKVAFTKTTTTGYFGARDGNFLRFSCTTFSSGGYFNFSMNFNDWPTDRACLILNTPYVLMAKNGQYSINDNTYQSAVLTDASFISTFLLFRYKVGVEYSNSFMRLYSIEFYENDILTHSFIPVRVDTTGYMYDKVTMQLFGNSGTGEFILGPDVN